MEDVEYARLLVDLDVRRARLADLEAEVAPLEDAFARFEHASSFRVGVVQRALHDVEEEIARFEGRIARIHARMVADPACVLGDLFSRDELHEIGRLFHVDPGAWHDAEQNRFERDREQWESHHRERTRHERFEPQRPTLATDVEREARQCYHALARRFHPDLAGDDEDRRRRQAMMLRVNAAWHARDLAALRAIADATDHEHPDWHTRPAASRLAWARRERSRLDGAITGLKERLAALRGSATLPLWMNPSLAETVLLRRVAHLTSELERARERLDAAKEAFRQALATFAVDRDVA